MQKHYYDDFMNYPRLYYGFTMAYLWTIETLEKDTVSYHKEGHGKKKGGVPYRLGI